ncbi:radical SAM family heme chaperone HemW [Bradyrhizobium diazoefficiens]|uniref:radical SAM family heme chaperone HemW n=1 Tax=Bradyrhizobium diazoefficiens TaxID=1355477 RepID=UPI0035997112
MAVDREYPLYEYWAEYPLRDKEYVRWYPPTLRRIQSRAVLDLIAEGPRPLAFYLHVPFCKDICPYCPFNKYSLREERKDAFLKGVLREIKMVAQSARHRDTPMSAGYFGGGTPTALQTPDILRIVEMCLGSFKITPGAEITIEANPDTVDIEKLRALRRAGVNRISFGVQSFRDSFLKVLGRTHSSDGALRAIDLAHQAGFDNVAIDLMYRVPGQSLDDWRADLRTALSAGVDHISTYCLFLDPGTRMYSDTLAGHLLNYPDEDAERAMYQCTQDTLGAAAFVHYTINDFSLAGKQSDHHLYNWQAPQRSYVGMGPGAFGYVEAGRRGLVYCTIHSLKEYLAAIEKGELPVRLGHEVGDVERQARYMVLGLRCLEVRKAPFREMFGVRMEDVHGDALRRLVATDLLVEDDERVRMTEKGRHFASNVLKAFYTPENRRMPQPIGVELSAGRGASMISVDSTGIAERPS